MGRYVFLGAAVHALGTGDAPAAAPATQSQDMLPGPLFSYPDYLSSANGPYAIVEQRKLVDGELVTVTKAPEPGEQISITPVPATPVPRAKLDGLGYEVSEAALRAIAASSDARSAASEARARENSNVAAEAAAGAQGAKLLVTDHSGTLAGAISAAEAAATSTVAAESAAKAAIDSGKALVAQATEEAASIATSDAQGQLAETLKEFQDWKMAVLHDPEQEGRAAGVREARPYERALQIVEKRVAEYEQRASSLSNQAQSLRTVAASLASGAVVKQAGGDLAGAAKDMTDAHQMLAQATIFEAQGLKLMLQAKVTGVNIPAYISGAQHAAHAAAYRYAKQAFAPPPVPPPGQISLAPPLNVLAQERSERHREAAVAITTTRRVNPFARPRGLSGQPGATPVA